MTGMFKPDINEKKPLPEPARLQERVVRMETPDDQLNRGKRKRTGRDQFKIDLASTPGNLNGSGVNFPNGDGGAVQYRTGPQLPRL